ncbi:MAG: RNA-guided endonuclease TnpB family protein [Nitriliruptoraceae bacterium]
MAVSHLCGTMICMEHDRVLEAAADRGSLTRAVEVVLDPSPSQERWLRSYVGSMRAAYNWALEQTGENLSVRRDERACGIPEDELTPALSWSAFSLTKLWREARDEVHPWHRDVSIHAFRTGLDNAALALKNFSGSRSGRRRGARVGFPRFKNRHSRQAVTFVELADGVDHRHWINPDTREHVRLMLPQRAADDSWERRHTRPRVQQAPGRDRRSEVAWLHTFQPDTVREVGALCASGRAKVQALTIKFEGGRWVAVFRLRLLDGRTRLRNPGEPVKHHGGAIGVDLGLKHLVTLDRPVDGLTDEHGHVPNPRILEQHLARLQRLDRATARCVKGSKNRAKLLRRRAKLHGKVTATRKLYLHELSRRLAGGFDVVCVEDLNVAGMGRRKGLRHGRSVAEASMGELARQLDYKTSDRSATLMRVGRFYPSSQTCSQCGARTKLALWQRVYDCSSCGLVLDRDVNAARNIRAEGQRLMREQHEQDVASIRGETRNGEPRPGETEPAQHDRAGGRGSFEAATDPAAVPVTAA